MWCIITINVMVKYLHGMLMGTQPSQFTYIKLLLPKTLNSSGMDTEGFGGCQNLQSHLGSVNTQSLFDK